MIIPAIITGYFGAGIAINLAANRTLNLHEDYPQLGAPLATLIQAAAITMWPIVLAYLAVAVLRDHTANRPREPVPPPIVRDNHQPVDARALANQLIARSYRDSRLFTHLQVQKLVYFCHAWCLAIHGQPMIRQEITMGSHGPLVQELLKPLGIHGGNQVFPIPSVPQPAMSAVRDALIDEVLKKYGKLSGLQLSSLAHQESSPWSQIRQQGLIPGTAIPDRMLAEYYGPRYEEYRQQEQKARLQQQNP